MATCVEFKDIDMDLSKQIRLTPILESNSYYLAESLGVTASVLGAFFVAIWVTNIRAKNSFFHAHIIVHTSISRFICRYIFLKANKKLNLT